MKVYAAIASKGGAGKTTTTVNLACVAKGKSLIVDCDDQESAASWFEKRPIDGDLQFIASDAKNLHTIIAKASAEGYENIFVDSAGRDAPSNRIITDLADYVVVPIRPSAYDLEAINESIDTSHKGLRLFVNQGYPMGSSSEHRNKSALKLMDGIGGKVCRTVVVNRAIFEDSGASGLGVTEMEPASKAANEIKQLWECINNG